MDLGRILGWPVRLLCDACRSQHFESLALVHRSAAVQALYHKGARCRQGTGAAPLNPEQKRALLTSTIIDTVLGLVAGGLLLTHSERLQALAAEGSERLVDGVLAQGTEWLMSVAPAGLKLNEELDVFMGRAVSRILKIFTDLAAQHHALLLASALWSLLLFSPLGLSQILALASDLLALATCHVSLLYWLSAFAYSAQLRALAALWRLFRGRKRNPLRHRVDSFECQVEQIVVGSLLFTPLLLLLPTTWAYYSLFAIAYGGIAATRAALQFGSAVVRSFPVYRLAVWAAVPGAFPCDVSFQVTSAGQKVRSGGRSLNGTVVSTGRTTDETCERSGVPGQDKHKRIVRGEERTECEQTDGTRADGLHARGQNRTERERTKNQERNGGKQETGDDSEQNGGNESAVSVRPGRRLAEQKLAGMPSEKELEARNLRLVPVTADAVDVLRPFLRHVTSPFSLRVAGRVVVAVCLGEWMDPVLTFDDEEL